MWPVSTQDGDLTEMLVHVRGPGIFYLTFLTRLNFSYLQGQQVVNTDGDSQTVGREGVIYIGKWWNKKSRKKTTDPNLSPRTSPGSVLDICLTFRWND